MCTDNHTETEFIKKGIYMKTLYLHIGTPKTATSSIQEFLQINRKTLEKHGCCFPKLPHKYPYVCSNRNAHFMVENLYYEDGTRDFPLEMEFLREGLDNVAECMKEFDNVILSEENLWRVSSYSHKELFPYLEQEARQQGYQIKIIVYLRRQDQFLVSNWNQCVKQGKTSCRQTLESFIKTTQKKYKLVLDYASKLDRMAELFGKENLIVRRFDPGSWVRHSIIHDFMDCIGLELTEDFILPSRMVNPGLSGNNAEIKRIINKESSFSKEENTFLTTFLKTLSPESGKRYPCSMLSREETRTLLNKYAAGNARVASEYIKDNCPLFTDDIPDLPRWEKDNPYMTEDIIRFFSLVSIDLRRENEILRQELKDLRQTVKDEQKVLRIFKNKLKHPFCTLWNRIFHHESFT